MDVYKEWLDLILKKNDGIFISPEAVGYCSGPLLDKVKYKKEDNKEKISKYRYC